MKLYSDAFLNDSYLKYVGWTMHDKVSPWKISLSLLYTHSPTTQEFPLYFPDQIYSQDCVDAYTLLSTDNSLTISFIVLIV